MTVEVDVVRVRFKHAGRLVAGALLPTFLVSSHVLVEKALVANLPGSGVQGFAWSEAGGKWGGAGARIKGETVVRCSPAVAAPNAVRYAWADSPTSNLYSAAGQPAAPFRTDLD